MLSRRAEATVGSPVSRGSFFPRRTAIAGSVIAGSPYRDRRPGDGRVWPRTAGGWRAGQPHHTEGWPRAAKRLAAWPAHRAARVAGTIRSDLRSAIGDVDGALTDFGSVLEIDPGHVDAYINRAGIFMDTGQWASATRLALRNRAHAVGCAVRGWIWQIPPLTARS
jgi:hypothetical protein